MTTMTTTHLYAVLGTLAVLALSGCGGGGGVSLGGGGAQGAFDSVIAQATAEFVVVDLASGSKTTTNALDTSDASLRSSKMAFRRVSGLGNDYLLGVFEITQAQWEAITGLTGADAGLPWNNVDARFRGALAGNKPALGLSFNAVQAGLSGFTRASLALPTDEQWVHACAAGTDPAFWSWGNTTDLTVVDDFAVAFETGPASNQVVPLVAPQGPLAAGSLQANPFGFFDMHGNVWEWTTARTVRGGSWRDSFQLARTNNALGKSGQNDGVSAATAHALFGARLVLNP